MRLFAWTGCLVMMISGCAATLRVGPMAAPMPTRAQWAGADAPRLVRQLVLSAFDRADHNHDRFLDMTEWDKAELTASDLDKDGRVTSLEWGTAHPIEPLVASWQSAAADYFVHLDADKNGWLARAEVKGLVTVPGFGMPSDLLFDRYSALQPGGISPKVFADFVLQVAFDTGRFQPMITPPAWPASDAPVAPPSTGEKPPTLPQSTLLGAVLGAQSRPRR
ncbi:MAG: hypothetical protein H7338_18045 [Candidatus Sericytochromatia bacterium]|nr:hypothetical protein [Candidatus Sericytochromatia bacterium]